MNLSQLSPGVRTEPSGLLYTIGNFFYFFNLSWLKLTNPPIAAKLSLWFLLYSAKVQSLVRVKARLARAEQLFGLWWQKYSFDAALLKDF